MLTKLSATVKQQDNVTEIDKLESIEAYNHHVFSWTINNFNDVYQKDIIEHHLQTFCKEYQNINCEFQLVLHGDYNANDLQSWLTVYFKPLNNIKSIYAILNELDLFDYRNTIAHVSKLDTNYFSDSSTNVQHLNLIKKAELYKKTNDFLADNKLKIYCEIIFFGESSTYKRV